MQEKSPLSPAHSSGDRRKGKVSIAVLVETAGHDDAGCFIRETVLRIRQPGCQSYISRDFADLL